MTERKHVAKTLKNVLDHPVMKSVLDKTEDPMLAVEQVTKWWGFDLYSRKPGAALRDGVFVGTDLDLACFLSAIADRGAVINIPNYKSMRPKTIKEGERVVSKSNRHGPVVNLVSNKDVFSFSIRIMDHNVITTDKVGDYRTYSLTDPSGEWYDGWSCIQWDPSAKENAFLRENSLWTGNRVVFKNFVHPNRWTSFYGQHYFITKALIQRLTDEAKFYGLEIKRLQEAGARFPESGDGAKKVWPKSSKDAGKSVKFRSLEVEIDIPEYTGEWQQCDVSQTNLIDLDERRRQINSTIIPNLRFATRCTELAFFKHAMNDELHRMPAWLAGGTKWQKNYVPKGKRTKWERLVLFQPSVGERAVAIRMRVKEKSEIMAMNYRGGV